MTVSILTILFSDTPTCLLGSASKPSHMYHWSLDYSVGHNTRLLIAAANLCLVENIFRVKSSKTSLMLFLLHFLFSPATKHWFKPSLIIKGFLSIIQCVTKVNTVYYPLVIQLFDLLFNQDLTTTPVICTPKVKSLSTSFCLR